MHTVFGRVVDGHKYVTEIENQRVDTNHRPYADIRIVRCGELVLIKPNKGNSVHVTLSTPRAHIHLWCAVTMKLEFPEKLRTKDVSPMVL